MMGHMMGHVKKVVINENMPNWLNPSPGWTGVDYVQIYV